MPGQGGEPAPEKDKGLSENSAPLDAFMTAADRKATSGPRVVHEQWEKRKKANKLIGYVFTNKSGDERRKDFGGSL